MGHMILKKKLKQFFIFTLLIGSLFFVAAYPGTTLDRVVMVPGWHGDPDIFKVMIPVLEQQGMQVVDFDDSTPGTQAVRHDAALDGGNLDIPALANQVEELVKAHTNADEHLNFVAHSMGGLITRYLIEKGPSDPLIDDNWAERIDKVIMLGTPNHGTWEAYVGQLSILFDDWAASAEQMKPGSTFLNSLGYSEPAGEEYITVGGDPWYLPGFDGVVPTDSPHLLGSEQYTIAGHHGELATLPNAIDLVLNTLGYISADTGESLPLIGNAFIRLEYFKMTGDHEWGDEEYYMDMYVDKNGGGDNYEFINTLSYTHDGPFTWNPGNGGPNTAIFALPETSPRMDVKIVLREDSDMINTFYFRDLMYSEDVDGMDYYVDTAPDPSNSGDNVMRISLNGITSDIGQTVNTRVTLTQVRVDEDGDWGDGENYFKTWTGASGYEIHYEKWAIWTGEDTYYIYDTYGPNTGYDAVVYSGRMVKTAQLHLKFELWDDDGLLNNDDHLNGDLNAYYTAQFAGGSYYYDMGDAAWWYTITIT